MRNACFSLKNNLKDIICGHVRKFVMLSIIFWTIYLSDMTRNCIIPIGTTCNCAHLVADLFLFCYERDFMLSLSDHNQGDVVEAFNSTSRYQLTCLILVILIFNKW